MQRDEVTAGGSMREAEWIISHEALSPPETLLITDERKIYNMEHKIVGSIFKLPLPT